MSRKKPPLAVVHLKLGVMTGLDVARQIGAISRRAKIISFTGYLDTLKIDILKDVKPVDIIKKPFRVKEFLKTIREALKADT